VGTGKIGKEMIDIALGFKMRILAYDKYPDKNFEKEKKISYVGFDDLLKESDIITLHCPLTEENHYMINKDTIKKMKDNVMLINTGRGQLIKTVDLIDGLKNHKIYAAGLDVYEEESTYFYRNYSNSVIADDILARLIFFPNVIVTSHQGFFTKEALENIASVTLQNIADFFDGKELKNEVFFKVNFEK
jgi:D-lactate dehydrogenase